MKNTSNTPDPGDRPIRAGRGLRVSLSRAGAFGFALGLACLTASVAWAGNSAAVVSQSVPTSMEAGNRYTVQLTFRNNGTTTWTENGGVGSFRLGSQNPGNNTIWRQDNRIKLAPGEAIRPGASRTFSFEVEAPAQPGTYRFQWQMLQEGKVGYFGQKSGNLSVKVATAPTGFGFDATRVHTLSVRGRNLLRGTGGIYLIGSADGSDAQGRSVTSGGASGGFMVSDNPAKVPPPPFRLSFSRIAKDTLAFKAEVGPVPITFKTMSLPFDFDQTMVDSFQFGGTAYRLGCTDNPGTKKGSGGRYDTLIRPKCEIRNVQGNLLGLVGVAHTDKPTPWGEVSGAFGKVRVTITQQSRYKSMQFHNHFGTHNLELSFGELRKGERASVEGTIQVMPR
jgi:hypothetical protein